MRINRISADRQVRLSQVVILHFSVMFNLLYVKSR